MKKMTFSLDAESVRELERASDRLGIPKSQVVREAVRVYGEQLGRLSEEERQAKLALFDEVVPQIPVVWMGRSTQKRLQTPQVLEGALSLLLRGSSARLDLSG